MPQWTMDYQWDVSISELLKKDFKGCIAEVVEAVDTAKAAKHLKHPAEISISSERIRQIVEPEGQLKLDIQRKRLLAAG